MSTRTSLSTVPEMASKTADGQEKGLRKKHSSSSLVRQISSTILFRPGSWRSQNSQTKDDESFSHDFFGEEVEDYDDDEDDNELEEGEEEELWEQHPTQDCSIELVSRLCKYSLRQVKKLPYFKKKKVSGLREVELSLKKLFNKIQAEQELLLRFQNSEEMKECILFLHNTLVLLSRKFQSITKRKYFLDAAYSKRILVLHQSLNSAVSEVFLCLSRKLVKASIEVRQEAAAAINSRYNPNQRSLSMSVVNIVEDDDHSQGKEEELKQEELEGEGDENASSKSLVAARDRIVEEKEAKSSELEGTTDRMYLGMRKSTSDSALPPCHVIGSRSISKNQTESKRIIQKGKSFGKKNSKGRKEKREFKKQESSISIIRKNESTSQSLYELGKLHYFDTGKDPRKAIVLLARAAQLEHTPAMRFLGELHEKGFATENPDLELARHFFQNAASFGDASSVGALALFNLRNLKFLRGKQRGLSSPESKEKEETKIVEDSLELLRKASKSGDAESMCTLGEFYLHGKFVERNPAKAKALFGAAAKKSHPRAQNNLGILILKSSCSAQSEELRKEGIQLLEMAAQANCSKALNNLGMIHEGIAFPSENQIPNPSLALELYRKASDMGLPLAMHNLGYSLLKLAENTREKSQRTNLLSHAIELFETAAAKGVIKSNYYLGVLYESGQGVSEQNHQVACHYYSKVISNSQVQVHEEAVLDQDGHLFAKSAFRLANIQYKRKHYSRALSLYHAASRFGCTESLNALGLISESGVCNHGEPNFRKAYVYYRKSHEMGNLDATFNLALLYVRGVDSETPRDLQRAELLLSIVVKGGGNPAARRLLSRVCMKSQKTKVMKVPVV